MKRQYVRDRRGFSLIELLIAIAIFLTSFCMIIGVFPVTFRSIQMAKNQMLATHFAEERIEYVKGMEFASILAMSEYNPPAPPPVPLNGSFTVTSMVNGVTQTLSYNWNIQVNKLPDAAANPCELCGVRVTVWWYENSNEAATINKVHSVDLYTEVAKLK
ncbi:MAG: prepilin-type N-terminal cleavage/methylation domain-containing protein [Candidatus Eremiobacteraeota bacterium]|nr:prepilin-type N-terminal cleavage/methylation domain-containing protein [Candidatus Eremiobacteraeota bacterium]